MARASNYQPIEGVTGTVLPASEFPLDTLECPWCPGRGPFLGAKGLRGHAWKRHRIKWQVDDSLLAASTIAKRKEFGPRALKPQSPQVPAHMSRWHRLAVCYVVLQGRTPEEAGEALGKNPKYVYEVLESPAGKQMSAWLRKEAESPETVARWSVQADAADAAVDLIVARDWAVAAKDYDAVHRIARDILKANKVFDSDGPVVAPVVHLHIGKGHTLEAPIVDATYEIIPAQIGDGSD